MLSRTKGYSDEVESSFLGKNLLNALNALGGVFPHLAAGLVCHSADIGVGRGMWMGGGIPSIY